MNEDIKNLIEKINSNLKELNENTSKLFSLLLKEEKKESKIPEGFLSFDFTFPIPKNSRLEWWFLNKILNRESERHKVVFIIDRNRDGNITRVLLKDEKEKQEHLNHILSASKWLNKQLEENAKRESQENKNIPSDLL